MLGESFLDHFATNTSGYEALPIGVVDGQETDEQQEFRENAWEALQANIILFNSDRSRYQSAIDRMNTAYMVTHQSYEHCMTYPMSIHNATEMLNHHQHDVRRIKNNRTSNDVSRRTNNLTRRNGGTNERTPSNSGTNLAQSSVRACYVCGSASHVAPNCPHKLRPKSQWVKPEKYRNYAQNSTNGNSRATTRNQSNAQIGEERDGDNDSNARNGTRNIQWIFVQAHQYKPIVLHQDDDDESLVQVNENEIQTTKTN